MLLYSTSLLAQASDWNRHTSNKERHVCSFYEIFTMIVESANSRRTSVVPAKFVKFLFESAELIPGTLTLTLRSDGHSAISKLESLE